MSWTTFDVVEGNSSQNADGQAQFTFLYKDSTKQTIIPGAELQYARDSHPTPPPNPTTIFTSTAAVNISNGVFTFVVATSPVNLPNNVNIPPVPGFGGGTYDQLASLVYNPTTNLVSGTFHDTGSPGTDPDCNWDATGTSPLPVGARKAGY